ncbi:AI-2E family transporter [Terriglobus sp. ADX1]
MFIGLGSIVALLLAWHGRVILMLLFAAIVVAALMTAVVEWLGTRSKIGRRISLLVILCVAGGLVGLTVWLSGPSIIAQFADLQSDLPQAAHQLTGRVNDHGWEAG